jgi:alkylation response protein AidB-like acyl-CoA dehydrogenase
MDFAFDEDQELLRSTARRFLEDRHPLDGMRPKLESELIFDRDVWREGAELGWTSMLIPEAHGGGSITEQPLVDLLVIAEEMGRVLYPGPFLATNVVADCVGTFGTEMQCKETLEAIATGNRVASWCFTADGSADLEAVEINAAETDGGLRLDGVARYVHEADNADVLLVTCNAPSGPTLALVPRSADGINVRVMGSIDLTRRFSEVTFESVEVPAEAVIGGAGQAGPAIERAQRLATVLQSAESVGAAERLFETTVQYAKDRVQFGRAIGSFQAIKHRLADLLIELEAARAAAWFAALAIADDREDRDEAVATAGSTVRDMASFAAGEALQIHGGVGFTWEYDVHLYLRRAKADQYLYGDPAWHRERLCQLVESAVEGQH